LKTRVGLAGRVVVKANGLLPTDTKVRSSKYQNNLIEQDHRQIKSRTNVSFQ
jgi:transposase-like protein